jgi:DNA uptake protein ComE-like DNA-binding protein
MKNIKSYLLFNARQRKGILYFLLIIIFIQIAYFLIDFTVPKEKSVIEKEQFYQQKIDSVKALTFVKKTSKVYSFNPNYINDFKGYQLGMTVAEIDRLLTYRAQGNFINSINDFQKITKIHDTLLKKISPYFKFPDLVKKSKNYSFNQNSKTEVISAKKEINKATEEDFIKINGIGVVLAKRIIQYRNKLGGFSYNKQLYDVWNLDKEVVDKVLEQYTVIEKPAIKKININKASFKEVLAVEYVDYDLCKKIFEYKKEIAEYQSIEELKKINGFPLDKYELIILYLDVK